MYAYLDYCPDKTTFLWAVLIIRVIQGYADSMNLTCIYSILATAYPNDISKSIAITEAISAIGIIMNSANGSFIYYLIGYRATFFWNSLLYIVLGFLSFMMIPKYLNKVDDEDQEESQKG